VCFEHILDALPDVIELISCQELVDTRRNPAKRFSLSAVGKHLERLHQVGRSSFLFPGEDECSSGLEQKLWILRELAYASALCKLFEKLSCIQVLTRCLKLMRSTQQTPGRKPERLEWECSPDCPAKKSTSSH
jgi:hypothetical protein